MQSAFSYVYCLNIVIKHDFLCIYICWTPQGDVETGAQEMKALTTPEGLAYVVIVWGLISF